MADRDYMGSWGRFLGHSSGKTKSFGVSLHQTRDFINRRAHAKGELPENSVARDLLASRSDMASQSLGIFMRNHLVRASGHPKIRWGPALTRNLKNLRCAHARAIVYVTRKAVS